MKDVYMSKFIIILIKCFLSIKAALMNVMTHNLFFFYKTLNKKEKFCAAVLADSSEAFDCISYDLIYAIQHVYGVDQNAIKLV